MNRPRAADDFATFSEFSSGSIMTGSSRTWRKSSITTTPAWYWGCFSGERSNLIQYLLSLTLRPQETISDKR
jgi:hypothetical protein